jgi:flagellar basal-body rod protein FlgB
MIEAMSGLTGNVIEVALDALSLQQRIHANNIANASANGFTAQRMDFENALRTVTKTDGLQISDMKEQLQRLDARVNRGELVRSSAQSGVELDVEMAGMSETVLKYQALIQGLIQYNSMTAMAIAGDVNK